MAPSRSHKYWLPMSNCGPRAHPSCGHKKSKLYYPVSTSWFLIGSASGEDWQETRGGRPTKKGYLFPGHLPTQFRQWSLCIACREFPVTPLSPGLSNGSALLLVLGGLLEVGSVIPKRRIIDPTPWRTCDSICYIARED